MEMPRLWKSAKSVDSHKPLGRVSPKSGATFLHFHRPYWDFSFSENLKKMWIP
jgi:hypothetical protein